MRILKGEGNQDELQRYMEVTKKYSDLTFLSLHREIKNENIESASSTIHKSYSKILPGLVSQLGRSKNRTRNIKLRILQMKEGQIS